MSERFSGTVEIVDGQGRQVFKFDSSFAVLDLGAQGNAGDLRIRGTDGQFKIHLDGSTGDIKLSGADCAEEFEVDEEPEELEPGSVMAIADGGRLRRCAQAYDRRVAGVISGAGNHKPGIILGRRRRRRQGSKGANNSRIPLALSGRVHCRVDAGYGPVGVGDLLTTSPTVGHAMRAEDPRRAFGATIGKALRPLGKGTGLVSILIALQ
jgi:hypothetical protein